MRGKLDMQRTLSTQGQPISNLIVNTPASEEHKLDGGVVLCDVGIKHTLKLTRAPHDTNDRVRSPMNSYKMVLVDARGCTNDRKHKNGKENIEDRAAGNAFFLKAL